MDFAVIFADPDPFAVTFPEAFTDSTEVSLLLHVRDEPSMEVYHPVSVFLIRAVSVVLLPGVKLPEDAERERGASMAEVSMSTE